MSEGRLCPTESCLVTCLLALISQWPVDSEEILQLLGGDSGETDAHGQAIGVDQVHGTTQHVDSLPHDPTAVTYATIEVCDREPLEIGNSKRLYQN